MRAPLDVVSDNVRGSWCSGRNFDGFTLMFTLSRCTWPRLVPDVTEPRFRLRLLLMIPCDSLQLHKLPGHRKLSDTDISMRSGWSTS